MEHKKRSSLRKHVVGNKGNQQSATKRRISFNSRKSIREFNQEKKETLDYDISDRSDAYAECASYKHINNVTSTIMDPKTEGVIHMKPEAEVNAGNETLEYINKPIQNTVLNIECSVDMTLFDDEPYPRNRYSEILLKKSLLNEPKNCEGEIYKRENSHTAATTINEHKEKLHTIVGSVSENCQSLPSPPKVVTVCCVEDMDISPSSDTEIKCKDNTRTPYNKTKVTRRQICLPSPALKSLAPVNQRLLAYYKNKQKDKMTEEMNATPAEPSSPINEVKKSLNFSFSTCGNESLPLYSPDVNITNLRQLNDDLESGKLQLCAEPKAFALSENKLQYGKYHCRFSQADDLMLDNTSFLTQAKLSNESTLRNSSKKSLNGLDICDDTLFFTQSSFQDRFPVNIGGAGYLKGTVNAQEGNSKSMNLKSNKKPLEDAQDVTSYGLEIDIEADSTGNNTKSGQTIILQEKIEGNIGVIQKIIKDRKVTKDELHQADPKSRRTMILSQDIEPDTTKSAVRKEHSRESRRTMILNESIEEDVLSEDKTIKATSTELQQLRITRRTQNVNADSRKVPQANPMLRKIMIFNQKVEIESPTPKENNTTSRQTMLLQENMEEDIVEDSALLDDALSKHKEVSPANPKSRKTMILNQDIEPEKTKSAVSKDHNRESRRTMILQENMEEDIVEGAALLDDALSKHKEVSQANPKSRKTVILNQDIEPENTKGAVRKEHSRESRRTMILQENMEEDIVEGAALLDDALSKNKEVSQANPKSRRIIILNQDIEPETTNSAVRKENNRPDRSTMILQENIGEDVFVRPGLLPPKQKTTNKEESQANPKSRRTIILNQDIETENIKSAVRKEHSRESRRTMILQENMEEDVVEGAALLDDALSKNKEVFQANPKSRKTVILNQDIEPENTKGAVRKEHSRESRRTMILQENMEEDIVEGAALLDDALSKHKEVSQANPKSRRTMILNQDIEPETTNSAVRKEHNRESRRTMILQENMVEDIVEGAALLDDALSKHKEESQANPKSLRTMILSQDIEPETTSSAVRKENNRADRGTMILQENIGEDVFERPGLLPPKQKTTNKEESQANPKSRRTIILNQDIETENGKSAVRKEHSRKSRRTMILQENMEEDVVEGAALLDDALSKNKEVFQANPKSRRTMILNQDIESETTNSAVRKENNRADKSTMTLLENIGEDVFVRPGLLPPKQKTTNKEESQENLTSRRTMILNQDIEPENTKGAVRKEHSRESRRTMILQENMEEDVVEGAALLDDAPSKHEEVFQANPKSRKTMILNQNIEPETTNSAVRKEHNRESRRTMILQENMEEDIVVEGAALLDDALSKHKEVSQANPKSRKTMILNQNIEPETTNSAVRKEHNRESRRTMILQENMEEDIVEGAALLDDALSKNKEESQANPKSLRTMILNQDIEPETTSSAVRKENNRADRSTMILQENIGEDVFVKPGLLPPKHKTTNKEESQANLKSRRTMILNQDIEIESTKSTVLKENNLKTKQSRILHEIVEEEGVMNSGLLNESKTKNKELPQASLKSRKTMILNEEIESVSCTKGAVCKENNTERRQTMIVQENIDEDVVIRPAASTRDKEITKCKTMILDEEIEPETTQSITRKENNQSETLQENIEQDREILYEISKTIKETFTGIPQSRITRSIQKTLLSNNADCRQVPEENSRLPKPRILKQINQVIQNKMEQTASSRERECGSFKEPTKIIKERTTPYFNETNEGIDVESLQTCQKSLVESKEIDHIKQKFSEASFNSEKPSQTLSTLQCSNVRIGQNKENIECFSSNREFSPNKRLTINFPQDINITQDFDNIENFAKPEKATRSIKKCRESIYREESMDLEENTTVEHNQQTLYLNTNIKVEGKSLNESTSALLDQDDQDFSKSQSNICTEQRMDIELDLDCPTNVGNGNRATVHLNIGKETQPKLTLNDVKMEANAFEEQVLDKASSVNKLVQSSCLINDGQFRTPLKTSANQERLRKMWAITPRQSLMEFTRLEKTILKQSPANYPTPLKGYHKTKTNYSNITTFEDFDGSLDAKTTKPKPKPFRVEISGLELNDSVEERTGIEQQQPPSKIMSYDMTGRISTLVGKAFDESQNNISIQDLRSVSTLNKWPHVKSLVLPSTSEESIEQRKRFDDNTISVPDVTKYLNEPSCTNISALPQIQCHTLNDASIQFIEEEQLTLVDDINIEDVDDDKEELIEEIKDESDSEDEPEDEQQQACGSIVNDGNNTTFLCRKCKRCQQTLTDETLTSDKSESFVLPVVKPLISIGLEKLLRSRQKPKLADLDDLWRSLDDDIDSTQNITNVVEDETLLAPSVDGVKDDFGTCETECGFIRSYKERMAKFEKEIKEKYDKLYKDPPLPVVESLKNKLGNNPKMSHWIFDYQLEICGLFMFVHRQLLTFKLKIILDEICPLGTEIHIKTIKTCDRVKQYMWTPIDFILDFQLKLQMPSNVQTMCKGHDAESIYKMLETLNQMIENTVKLGRELQIVAFKYDASLKTDGPNRYYIRKILRRVVKSADTYDRVEKLEFQIDVYNIEALNFRNIAKPRLHNFQEDVQLLPTGIEFLNVFLSDPLKFIKPELKQSIFH